MFILCLYYVCIMFVLCLYYVYIMFILCLYYVYIVFILCLYYVYIVFILCLYYVYIMFILCLYYVSRCLHNTAHKAHRREAANMAALWVSHFDVTHSHDCHNIHAPLLFSLSSPLVWHTRQKWQTKLNADLLMACLIENIPGNPPCDGPPYRMLTEIGMCL